MACGDVFMDGDQTCDDFLDEDCTTSSDPDINIGEVPGPFDCADLCHAKGFPFYIFDGAVSGDYNCKCFYSPGRAGCTGISGPPLPSLESCQGVTALQLLLEVL